MGKEIFIIYNNPICHDLLINLKFLLVEKFPDAWGNGINLYTIGQRKGLNIGGSKKGNGQPWFVVEKDIKNNRLIVAQGHQHPLLLKDGVEATDIHWISEASPKINWVYSAKTRYRQSDSACEIDKIEDNGCTVMFGQKQLAMTPGQSLVLYESNVCLGGGFIKNTIDL